MKSALNTGAVAGTFFLSAAGAAVGYFARARRAVPVRIGVAPGGAQLTQAQQKRTMTNLNIGLRRTGRDGGR